MENPVKLKEAGFFPSIQNCDFGQDEHWGYGLPLGGR